MTWFPYITLRNKAVIGVVPSQRFCLYILVLQKYILAPFEKVRPQWKLLYVYFWECKSRVWRLHYYSKWCKEARIKSVGVKATFAFVNPSFSSLWTIWERLTHPALADSFIFKHYRRSCELPWCLALFCSPSVCPRCYNQGLISLAFFSGI